MEDITGLGKVANATLDVAKLVIEKLSNAVGVIYCDCDYKIRKEAEKQFIKNIMSDTSIDDNLKIILVSNHKQVFKHYRNQEKIVEFALGNIEESSKIDKVDDDWLSYFFDNAKNVSKENIQVVWGKLLANELTNYGSVSKSLIHILATISNEDAEAFNKLCRYSCEIDGKEHVLIFDGYEDLYTKDGLDFSQLSELARLGLIQYNSISGFVSMMDKNSNKTFEIKLFDKLFSINSKDIREKKYKVLEVGNVLLTKDGDSLLKAINPIPSEEMLELIPQYYRKSDSYEVKEIDIITINN